jgi:hypothetical protein
MALLSKISQLPKSIRDQLNERLENGQLGPEILPWLNSQPETLKLCAEKFKGIEVSDQNLSTWRETGYYHWQEGQKRAHHLRRLTETAIELGENSHKLLAGGGAIAAGHIMEILEGLDLDSQKDLLSEKPESLTELLDKLAKLTAAQTMQARLQLDHEKHDTAKDKLTLDREKFEVAQAKAVLKYAQSSEVQSIVKGSGSNADKIAALRARMFPSRVGNQETLPLQSS